jgi:hypothetical protein
MKSEAAEQVAAPAESSNTQLAPGTYRPIKECGWKGGDRDSARAVQEVATKPFSFLDRLYFIGVSAGAVKALRFASTAYAARRTRPGLRPLTPKIPNHPVKERKKANQRLDSVRPSHGRPAREGGGGCALAARAREDDHPPLKKRSTADHTRTSQNGPGI